MDEIVNPKVYSLISHIRHERKPSGAILALRGLCCCDNAAGHIAGMLLSGETSD